MISNVAQFENMAVLRVSYAVMLFRALLWTGGESCGICESKFPKIHWFLKIFNDVVAELGMNYVYSVWQKRKNIL